ncbi:MAG: hypothetical protein NT027_03540, partial [Proteobacteria bacterium]|nr:hypothetical protein [Pseudomonadota bacterium]
TLNRHKATPMSIIDGQTKLLGLVGKKTNYTLSPMIHTASAQELGINQIYVNFDLDSGALKEFIDSFWHSGGIGLNITKPYKELVAKWFPNSNLKSVNTLYRSQIETWAAQSTDGEGFVEGLKHAQIDISAITHLIILGSGGAVKGLLQYVLPRYRQIRSVDIFTRNSVAGEELQLLGKSFGISISLHEWNSRKFTDSISHNSNHSTLIIQGTSGPQSGDLLTEFVPALSSYKGAFCDLIYDQPSALFHYARSNGLKCQDGLPMLIEQARLSQLLWWNKAASYEFIFKLMPSKI